MTTFSEALAASLDYFNGDELAANVYLTKYPLSSSNGDILEPTPDDMHRRLAREFARIEQRYVNPLSEEYIYNSFKGFKYIIPQGSPMAGIGNPSQTMSISNCFVIDSPFDSYGGILKTDQEEAQIMKRRGGVGFDISTIRPKGVQTANAAKTTDGIGVFMERFSNTCREVAQGGRRGALMLSISVHHPEIETFINIKRDKTKVTGANISVRLTDEFMKAVENDEDYQLRFPVDSKEPTIVSTIPARKIWDQIIESAHESAEPGLLFWDTVQRRTPAEAYPEFRSVSTNPCQPPSATVLTPNGIGTIGNLQVGDKIWSEDGWVTVINKVSTGVKDVYRYRTNSGVFYGTENHRVVSKGVKVEARHADTIDALSGPTMRSDYSLDPQHVIDGLVLGDGSVHTASNNLVYLCVGDNDQDYFNSEVKDLIGNHRPGIKDYAYEVTTTLVASDLLQLPFRTVPSKYFYAGEGAKRAFLRGLFSANGSVVANGKRVTLKATSSKLIEQVQIMLSSLGITSYITKNKPVEIEFSNGNYLCRQSYDLNITKDRGKFQESIGFIQEYKNLKIDEYGFSGRSKKSYDIISVDFYGTMEVLDITVDGPSHTYWTGGVNVSNCGEIVLSPYDSCRLLLVNVLSFVKNPFMPEASFDFESFKNTAYIAQRYMDDMVDLEIECIDKILAKIESDPEPEDVKASEIMLWQKIRHACTTGRRTGTGVTAIGDTLAALNLAYGSDQGIEMIEQIYKTLAIGCYMSTIDLASERGAFPVYDKEKELENEFLHQMIDALPLDYVDRWKKTGRRNIALTTTAPAGSVSVLTQTTSGIEPVYLLEYKRRKKINPNDKDITPDFIDELGDKWVEFPVYHHGFQQWMEITGKTDPKESPYYGSTSNDIDWVQKIKAQAAAQKWICHAISNTTNLPADVSIETVKDIYMTGWKSGCKGVTIYRDGSRSGVLISNEEKPKDGEIEIHHAPKRPIELPCEVHNMTVLGEKWTFFVGLLNGRPYEIMGGLSKHVTMPKRVKYGKTVKHNGPTSPKARYDFHYDFEEDLDNEVVLKDIATLFDNATYSAFTRTISLALRHGTDVRFVVEQIQKGAEREDDLFSFSKAVSRVLKGYIQEGTKVVGKKCSECGSNDLKYAEGCISCNACGWSKCT